MPFDPQPVLEGDGLTLRPLCEDDFDALYAVACDPLIWEQHPDPDRHRPEVFRAFFEVRRGSWSEGAAGEERASGAAG